MLGVVGSNGSLSRTNQWVGRDVLVRNGRVRQRRIRERSTVVESVKPKLLLGREREARQRWPKV